MGYILIRPMADRATEITNHWGADLAGEHVPAADLNGELATEESLRAALAAYPDIKGIVFYGHGELDNLTAQTDPGEPAAAVVHALEGGVLPHELQGYKLYAVACYAGTKLGPALSKAGCQFIGYVRKFEIPDGFEAYAEEVVNEGCAQWLVDKQSQEKVVEILQKRWDDLVEDFTFGKHSGIPEAFQAAAAFLNNKNALCQY